MVEPRPRGSYASGRARREQILDLATARFAELGYHRTSLATVAADVGLTAAGLAHHFPSKQHLLVAVADRRFDVTRRWAQEAPPDEDGTGPLRGMLDLMRRIAGQPGLMQLAVLVAAEVSDPASPAHEQHARRYAAVVEQLAATFEASVEAGHWRDDLDCPALARECVAVSDGLQLQWALSGGRLDVVALAREHLQRLAPHVLRSGRRVAL